MRFRCLIKELACGNHYSVEVPDLLLNAKGKDLKDMQKGMDDMIKSHLEEDYGLFVSEREREAIINMENQTITFTNPAAVFPMLMHRLRACLGKDREIDPRTEWVMDQLTLPGAQEGLEQIVAAFSALGFCLDVTHLDKNREMIPLGPMAPLLSIVR